MRCTHIDECSQCDYKRDALRDERDGLREALTEVMVEMLWDQPGWDQMDLQEAMVRRGILVEAPAPQKYIDEYDSDTWFTMAWLVEAKGE